MRNLNNLIKQSGDDWIYFDKEKNKIAINNWHLSARKSSEEWYNELMDAYSRFIETNPSFVESHRR